MEYYIRWGRYTTRLKSWNEGLTFDHIMDLLRQNFINLPANYHVEFYSPRAKKPIILDDDVLQSERDAFLEYQRNNSNASEQSIADWIEFFVVGDSYPVGTEDNQIEYASNSEELALSLNELHPSLGSNEDEFTFSNTINESEFNNNTAYAESTGYDRSNAVTFCHDVHPFQKDKHLSDRFRIFDKKERNANSTSGGLSLLQGKKTELEIKKKKQVSPLVKIPPVYRYTRNTSLVVYAVYEKQVSGQRYWFKHSDKGFLLADQLRADAKFLNPIEIPLDPPKINEEGNYKLLLYLLTERNKTSEKEILVFKLTEEEYLKRHNAEHFRSRDTQHILPVRLFCYIRHDGQDIISTIGLSDFIRPVSQTKLELDTSTVLNGQPKSKRPRSKS